MRDIPPAGEIAGARTFGVIPLIPRSPATVTSDPRRLCDALSVTRFHCRWRDDLRLQDGHDFCGRIRGAWGWRLRRWAEAGNAEAEEAHRLFFPDKADGGMGQGLAPPYRIAAQRCGMELEVTLSLIGFAGRWRQIAFDALVDALAQPPGLALWAGHETGARLRLLDAYWTRSASLPEDLPVSRLALAFRTPLRIGPKDALGTSFQHMIFGLVERGMALGRWMGIHFEPNLSEWRDRVKPVRFETQDLRPVVWDTYSSRNGRDKAAGYIGTLRIVNPEPSVMAMLRFGTVVHAGRAPAKGYGRFEIYADP